MKKISILIICLLTLFGPISILAQVDSLWMLDNALDGNNNTSEEQISLKTLELSWTAETFTPFGYAGRALPIKESWVIVNAYVALANGNPQSLKYSWFLDGDFQENKSGYGKNSFKFGVRKTGGSSHAVLLKLFNESRSFYTEKTIVIPIASPEIVVYKKDGAPNNPAYLSSSKRFEVASEEESAFLALPYFFAIKSLNELEFEWKLGEKTTKESSLLANVFGLKIINKEVGGVLEETLRVSAKNKYWPTQKIIKNINLDIY